MARPNHKVTKQSAKRLADNVLRMKQLTPVGASSAEIFACVAWLRDCAQNLNDAWGTLGLPSVPMISASVHTMDPMPDGTSIVYFGAIEAAGRSRFAPTVVQSDSVAANSSAMTWFMFGNALPDLTMGGDPGEVRSISVTEFFSGHVFVDPLAKISRFDVIARYTNATTSTI